ncbi:MAG TPA: hypothetical protein VG265_00400 [Gaiellaceae bacterium]|jgi:hypothetical protein|nr:hypothetical protein [Gaiellaceae bacterium]
MTIDFDDLVGGEVSGEEREELRRVHELLLSATPPPSLDPLPPTPSHSRRSWIPRSWAHGAVGLAAVASIAIAIGLAIGSALGHGGFQTGFTRPMHGLGSATAASALINVGKADPNGNRPLLMSIRKLPTLPKDTFYMLYLTKKGKPVVLCGIFQTGRSGNARVSMNAPADLAEYDGWIVTAFVPGQSPRVLLST